jgi:ADP-ribose pyrophosphatase YjhB (NUDIX family)
MNPTNPTQKCAGGIVLDARRRLLVVQRANPPGAGSWSIPGGRCEPGESPTDCCVREVREETGLRVEVIRWVGQVFRDGPVARYDIEDFLCRVVGGELVAGDDAAAVAWFGLADFSRVEVAPGLLDCLAEWELLPD